MRTLIALVLLCGTASAQVAGVGIGAEIDGQRQQIQNMQQQMRQLQEQQRTLMEQQQRQQTWDALSTGQRR